MEWLVPLLHGGDDPWPFDQGPDVAAITTRQVIEEDHPVLVVTHYEDDHSWGFVCGTTDDTEDVRTAASLIARGRQARATRALQPHGARHSGGGTAALGRCPARDAAGRRSWNAAAGRADRLPRDAVCAVPDAHVARSAACAGKARPSSATGVAWSAAAAGRRLASCFGRRSITRVRPTRASAARPTGAAAAGARRGTILAPLERRVAASVVAGASVTWMIAAAAASIGERERQEDRCSPDTPSALAHEQAAYAEKREVARCVLQRGAWRSSTTSKLR